MSFCTTIRLCDVTMEVGADRVVARFTGPAWSRDAADHSRQVEYAGEIAAHTEDDRRAAMSRLLEIARDTYTYLMTGGDVSADRELMCVRLPGMSPVRHRFPH